MSPLTIRLLTFGQCNIVNPPLVFRRHSIGLAEPLPAKTLSTFYIPFGAQKQGETVAEYVEELKPLAEHCGYDSILNDMLRDRLVCGIVDGRIQRWLLAEPTLTFQKAFELAQRQLTETLKN